MRQTIEIPLLTQDGRVFKKEVPISDTFELRGEMFALIADHDYMRHVWAEWYDEGECCGDVSVTHIGTGCNVKGLVWFPDKATAMQKTDASWPLDADLYEVAANKGFPKVRGTISMTNEVLK